MGPLCSTPPLILSSPQSPYKLSLPLFLPPSPLLPQRLQKKKEERPKNQVPQMGLCSDLNDVSSDSIPLLLVALFANCICYLKSLLFCLLQSVGLSRFGGAAGAVLGVGPFGSVGSGLAGLVLLAEQLNVHRVFTFSGSDVGSDCVVCLSGLREGEQVRMLACRHVFHRECLDGWFDHQNLNCPLCRAPLVAEERVAEMGRRVGGDLVTWFSPTR